jgi:hypothetical protein
MVSLSVNHMRTVVYLVYGAEGIFAECLLSIASLLKWTPEDKQDSLRIVLYTDKPEWFEGITSLRDKLTIRPTPIETVMQWRGPRDFVHRAKIVMLQDALPRYGGPMLYLDSDVVFLSDPEPLWNWIETGGVLMHTREGSLAEPNNPMLRKLNRFFRREKPRIAGLNKPPEQMDMWNAGILGFHDAQGLWLDTVLAVTDDLHARYPKHVMEQFAFSWVFQEKGRLKAADDIIWHYWYHKSFRERLLPLMPSWHSLATYDALLAEADAVLPELLSVPAPKPKLSFWKRLGKKLGL